MVVTQILGGLGNQMFQYATGRALAWRLNTGLKLDFSGFKAYPLRRFALNCFKIQAAIISQKELDKAKRKLPKFLPPSFKKAASYLIQRIVFKEKHFYEKSFHRFDPNFFKLKGNVYLHGIWHSEKYFKNAETIIRKDFSFKKPPDKKNKKMLERISRTNSVSIHVRRTDFVNNPNCLALGLDFYQKAVALIKKKISNPFFFVFSDDLSWCQANLKVDQKTVYVDCNLDGKDYEDMRLMSSCQHHIIANSAFSWWGAWLNANKNKIVIGSKRWLKNRSLDTSNMVPESWLRI